MTRAEAAVFGAVFAQVYQEGVENPARPGYPFADKRSQEWRKYRDKIASQAAEAAASAVIALRECDVSHTSARVIKLVAEARNEKEQT